MIPPHFNGGNSQGNPMFPPNSNYSQQNVFPVKIFSITFFSLLPRCQPSYVATVTATYLTEFFVALMQTNMQYQQPYPQMNEMNGSGHPSDLNGRQPLEIFNRR